LSSTACSRKHENSNGHRTGNRNSGLDGPGSGLVSSEPFQKRPVKTIEDFNFNFDVDFKSDLFGIELYKTATLNMTFDLSAT